MATLFARCFTNPTGTDPYSHAVSDVYQDLAGEGNYHGKGIYDLEAFHRVLSGRFPEAHLLSHDLLEGSFVRVGLASDIELFDQFPADYQTYAKRQHRWIRGDWQIADWLLRSVPNASGRERNPLSAFNRWKILDNLRRSLVPIASLALLLCGWLLTVLPGLWSAVVATVFLLPPFLAALNGLARPATLTLARWRDSGRDLLRALATLALLPHQAVIALDAIVRVGHRRLVSHRLLLQWDSAQTIERRTRGRQYEFLLKMAWATTAAAVIAFQINLSQAGMQFGIQVFALLWLVAPLIVIGSSRRAWRPPAQPITAADRRMLRLVARRTWRYFDDFVNAESNWLPPDNYQEFMLAEIAQRTSPTNIGFGLLANLAARDFGYITTDDALARTGATLDTLARLERFEGHLLNWYNTATLEPLHPRYISMVDSGNLLAACWTVQQGYEQLLNGPVVAPSALAGLADVLALIAESGAASGGDSANESDAADARSAEIEALHAATAMPRQPLEEIVRRIALATVHAETLAGSADAAAYWPQQLVRQANAWRAAIGQYLPWVQVLAEPPPEGLLTLGSGAHEWRRRALAAQPSLRMLASGNIPGTGPLLALHMRAEELGVPQTARDWLDRLAAAVAAAQRAAAQQVACAERIVARVGELADTINMRFLYREERKLFAIGYNVSDLRLDNSYYDLLASEARLGSFTAIARGDVPVEHWWALGRPYASAFGRRALLSWSGTMFEYLMPLLLTRSFKHSLLDQACAAAVASQIDYGGQRGIPWGISEAAFSALDAHQIYQYRAFGVPGLGLKRGLEEDLVVSPYSSALALQVAPAAALENLRRMADLEPLGLLGDYGFFESIDYSRQRDPRGARGVPVHAYMAHHQGMILAALDNALHDNIMPARFHADARVRAAEPLLFERIPQAVAVATDYAREAPLPRLLPLIAAPQSSRIATPDTSTPKVHLLSNGSYSVMVTNSGGGYSRFRDIDITRWRADTTRDGWGSFIYLKAMRSGRVWSAMHQPMRSASARHSVSFNEDKAEFFRRDEDFDTQTEIVVSPEDNTEIRRVTLINHSSRERVIEVTSYAEIVLAAHNADRAHPAFNNLFVETEALPQTLLAWRRAGSPNDAGLWAAHSVSPPGAVQFETERAAFIGRGRTLDNPQALERALTGTAGTVLDPVFSLRRRVILAGNARVQLSFFTAVADSREQVLAIAQKYADTRAITRAFELAWTHTQLEMRRLRIHRDDSRWFEELAGHLLYPHAQLRPPVERLRRNALGQSGLWAHGISGDLPIIIATVADAHDIDLVAETLTAWNYLRLRGLKTDLVILNEEAASYEQTLHDRLRRLTLAHGQTQGQTPAQGATGNVFLLAAANLPERDLNLMLASARVVLVAARGSLRKQLTTPAQTTPLPQALTINQRFREEPSPPLYYMELPYFNGLGGFTQDGREYVIYLGPKACTPAPWVNVMANVNFGALVSESGSGFTWYGNSQSNRLTPWSNDAVGDPAGDAIYIRDDDMGVYWTPTASPIRELDAYRARHGQGYSVFEHNSHAIEQELLTFVPVDDNDNSGDDSGDGAPLRIQKLRLRNVSTRARRLSVMFYAEWVLGAQREETQQHVISSWDSETQALLARNAWHPDFAGRVAFAACSPIPSSYTADRGEFIGRNGSLAAPAALTRTRLSRSSGAGFDPCAALQVRIELDPGQEVEVIFLLGQGESPGAVRELIRRYRDAQAVAQALAATRAWWDKTLGVIEVKTPDLGIDFLLNRWLLYQDLSCRIWGRSAFYQSGGAYGFRDQLQDVLAVVYAAPRIARAQILRAASRQFREGDVQHWWHPPSGAGVRTRISDDLLWLPYVTAQYVRITGDSGILDEAAPFLDGAVLEADEHDKYFVPSQSAETASLLEHCRRAVEKGATEGVHGLPLIGGGDWNDGMNRVGAGGVGESVWLAWFLVHVLHDWAYLSGLRGGKDAKTEVKTANARAARLTQAIEQHAWDGDWYLRAFYDDGAPLGSA
ncbi:MAG: protein ndvB, partial [Pseudomonadota bacterium]|nr:protein ndvB [Pseudomonadota bacterium]